MDPVKKTNPFVAAVVDLGAAWAAHGLDAGRLSLERSAGVLTRSARTLETLVRELEKKHPTPPRP
jgi:hypothetical protein